MPVRKFGPSAEESMQLRGRAAARSAAKAIEWFMQQDRASAASEAIYCLTTGPGAVSSDQSSVANGLQQKFAETLSPDELKLFMMGAVAQVIGVKYFHHPPEQS